MIGGLVGLLIAIVVIGLVMYLVETLIPQAEPWRTGARVVGVLILIVILLRFAGLY